MAKRQEQTRTRATAPAFAQRPSQVRTIESLRVVTEIEAAAALGVSPDTLRRRAADGTGPRRIQLSTRRIGYRVTDLEAWLAERA